MGENVLTEEHVVLDRCSLHGVVTIGFRSYANESLIREADIGRFCSIGRRCSIGAARHPTNKLSSHPLFLGDYDFAPRTKIGNDVWIGDGSVVMSGLTIGDGAIIGSNAVVTRDVAPYAIVAGVPARIIRPRFDAATIDKLLVSQWWNYGDAAVCDGSIDECLARLEGADELSPHHRWRQ